MVPCFCLNQSQADSSDYEFININAGVLLGANSSESDSELLSSIIAIPPQHQRQSNTARAPALPQHLPSTARAHQAPPVRSSSGPAVQQSRAQFTRSESDWNALNVWLH